MPDIARINGTLKLSIAANPGYLAGSVTRSAAYDLFLAKLEELKRELERESYIGASDFYNEPSLKDSWDIQYPRRETVSFNIVGKVTNTAPNALERIIGRGPGKFPPPDEIQKWVEVKIEPDPKRARAIAYVIGRAIAEKGTKRYRSGENFLDLNPDGSFREESIVLRYERELGEILSLL